MDLNYGVAYIGLEIFRMIMVHKSTFSEFMYHNHTENYCELVFNRCHGVFNVIKVGISISAYYILFDIESRMSRMLVEY